eukprot:m.117921 g.117921  ORF g.117921 m.117921 type:complete len:129 (+) comp15439_c0_seq1:116-502(+)
MKKCYSGLRAYLPWVSREEYAAHLRSVGQHNQAILHYVTVSNTEKVVQCLRDMKQPHLAAFYLMHTEQPLPETPRSEPGEDRIAAGPSPVSATFLDYARFLKHLALDAEAKWVCRNLAKLPPSQLETI